MNRARVLVVKVGGSLLTTEQFAKRLGSWLDGKLAAHADAHFVLVIGGGKWVDAIRKLDAHAPLGDERAHWICIELMDVTAGLVSAMLPELYATANFDELERRTLEPGVTLLKPFDFLTRVEPKRAGERLPVGWSVTSDSIAARLAIVLEADEMILLKSVPPPSPLACEPSWIERMSAIGYIDKFFSTLDGSLPPLAIELLPAVDENP